MSPKKNNTYAERCAGAIAMLDGMGAGNQMASWTEYVSAYLQSMRAQARKVADGVLASSGFAYFNYGTECIADWDEARMAITAFMLNWNNRDSYSKAPVMASVVAVDNETLEYARILNRMKGEWEQIHSAIRLVAGRSPGGDFNTSIASENMRSLLRHIGESRLNLDATDRKIPIVDGFPLSIRWYLANARPTARRTIADLVDEMRTVRENHPHMDANIRHLLDTDMAIYSAMDQSKEIAFRARRENPNKPLVSCRFRMTYLDGKIRRQNKGYAANPILCLAAEPVFTPTMKIYEDVAKTKIQGALKNVKTMGPVKRVSDLQLTRVPLGELPFYFWYKEPPKRQSKAPAISSKKNPYSATAFPGLWLGPRKVAGGLNPVVIVQLQADRSQRRFSISKFGLESAWEQAARVYSADRNIELDAVVAMCPSMQSVNDMLEWAGA